jgi:hypothetical protein
MSGEDALTSLQVAISMTCITADVSGVNIKKGTPMIPFVTMTDTRGQKISVNPEIVQFVRAADNADNECLIVFGKDQLLRVRGTLEEVTRVLREA